MHGSDLSYWEIFTLLCLHTVYVAFIYCKTDFAKHCRRLYLQKTSMDIGRIMCVCISFQLYTENSFVAEKQQCLQLYV